MKKTMEVTLALEATFPQRHQQISEETAERTSKPSLMVLRDLGKKQGARSRRSTGKSPSCHPKTNTLGKKDKLEIVWS